MTTYLSDAEMNQFKPDQNMLNTGLLGSCSQASLLAPRKEASEVSMGREEEEEEEKEKN